MDLRRQQEAAIKKRSQGNAFLLLYKVLLFSNQLNQPTKLFLSFRCYFTDISLVKSFASSLFPTLTLRSPSTYSASIFE